MSYTIKIGSREECKAVQEKLFEMGFGWEISKQRVSHTHAEVLYAYADTTYIYFGSAKRMEENDRPYIHGRNFLFTVPQELFEI